MMRVRIEVVGREKTLCSQRFRPQKSLQTRTAVSGSDETNIDPLKRTHLLDSRNVFNIYMASLSRWGIGCTAISRVIKRRSKKAGLPPGTVVYVGEKKDGEVKIRVIDYDDTHFEEKAVQDVEESFPFKDQPTTRI